VPASEVLGERDAWHLLRRAGFGASPRALAAFAPLSRASAVESLLAVKPSAVAGPGTFTSSIAALERLQCWWLRRMLSPRFRLQEKMVLFWHDHFPSSATVIRYDLLAEQNAMFRRHGFGSYPELLHRVTRNRAMLEYLDLRRSRKGALNENYARELMELFTLGPSDAAGFANYTQQDVVFLSRALTGFVMGTDKKPVAYVETSYFDAGMKVIFSQRPFERSGVLGLEERDGTPFPPETNVLDALFAHRDGAGRPTLASFLARKLWAWFADPQPEDELVDELAFRFVASGYQIGELVRAILTHDAFYSERARSSTPKTPVDFALQALLALGVKTSLRPLPSLLTSMGMKLFDPPGVEGWQHGPAWLAASRYLARMQLAQAIASGRSAKEGFLFRPAVPAGATPETLVDAALARLGLELAAATREGLVSYVGGGDFGSESWYETRYRGLFVLLLSLPEFQVH
jgi:uncharacterized protein (DUF1800 family)